MFWGTRYLHEKLKKTFVNAQLKNNDLILTNMSHYFQIIFLLYSNPVWKMGHSLMVSKKAKNNETMKITQLLLDCNPCTLITVLILYYQFNTISFFFWRVHYLETSFQKPLIAWCLFLVGMSLVYPLHFNEFILTTVMARHLQQRKEALAEEPNSLQNTLTTTKLI